MNNKYASRFMLEAINTASNSHCKKRKTGAVLVENDRIIMTGYNGTPKGEDNCCEEWSYELNKLVTKSNVIHAEDNVFISCKDMNIDTNGCTLYITYAPCTECAKKIIANRVTSVIYLVPDTGSDPGGVELLLSKNIEVIRYTDYASLIADYNQLGTHLNNMLDECMQTSKPNGIGSSFDDFFKRRRYLRRMYTYCCKKS